MPRPFLRTLLTLTGVVGVVSVALAQDTAALRDVMVCQGEHSEVRLTFSFDGSACISPEMALVETSNISGIASVTVPTSAGAEVCTMQLAPVQVSQVIAVDPETTALSIVVLDPEDRPIASGDAEIAETSHCDTESLEPREVLG